MRLYSDRNKIIKLFEDKNIKPTNYSHDTKSEPENSEPGEFEKKYSRKNKNEKTKKLIINKQTLQICLIYKDLNSTKNAEGNKIQADLIKNISLPQLKT